jgi:hypothetical protein
VLDLFETECDTPVGEAMPARALSEMSVALPFLRQRYSSHRAWAATPIKSALSGFNNVREASATALASMVFLNHGDHFEARPLPREAQWAPVWSVVANDFDGDGSVDLFLAQNFSGTQLGMARLDSGRGLLLHGDGAGAFMPVPHQKSGISIYGDQRSAAIGDFNEDGRPDLVVSQNGGAAQLLRNTNGLPGLRVRLVGNPGNPAGLGAVVRLFHGEKVVTAREIHGGSGWLSQNSPAVFMPIVESSTNAELRVRWPGGKETKTAISPSARNLSVNRRDARVTR